MDFTMLRPRRVYDVLADHPDRPSPRTVDRWCGGADVPKWAQVLVAAKIGHPSDTTKDPRPKWAEAMENRIVSEVQANREALYARLAEEAAEKALRRAGLLPDELTDGKPDQPPGSAGRSQVPSR